MAGTFESSAGSSPCASRPATRKPAAVFAHAVNRKTTVPFTCPGYRYAYRRTVVGAIRRRCAVVVVVVTPHLHAYHAGRLRLRHVIVFLLPAFLGHGGRHGGRRQQRRQQTHRGRHGRRRPAIVVVRTGGCYGRRRRRSARWRRHVSPLPLLRCRTSGSGAPCSGSFVDIGVCGAGPTSYNANDREDSGGSHRPPGCGACRLRRVAGRSTDGMFGGRVLCVYDRVTRERDLPTRGRVVAAGTA